MGHQNLIWIMTYRVVSYRQIWYSDILTHCGLVTPYCDMDLVNIGSGNGFCLTAQSHYLNQCWLVISKIHWHSSEGIFIREISHPSITKFCLKIPSNLPGDNEQIKKHATYLILLYHVYVCAVVSAHMQVLLIQCTNIDFRICWCNVFFLWCLRFTWERVNSLWPSGPYGNLKWCQHWLR